MENYEKTELIRFFVAQGYDIASTILAIKILERELYDQPKLCQCGPEKTTAAEWPAENTQPFTR